MPKHQSYYNGDRPEIKPFLPNEYRRVLEIGCGNGDFRKTFPKNIEYWGMEPAQEAARQAENQLNRVLEGFFETVHEKIPDNYFDLVICNDVIEHIADPRLFIEILKTKLTPQACIVGSIPNVRYYKVLFALVAKKDWKYTNKGVLDNTHLRFFTKKSLNRFFIENGFVCEKLKGINSAVYLKKRYCTSVGKTCVNLLKYLSRLFGFTVFDLMTLGHGTDIKYNQFAFRFRLPCQRKSD